jgi:polysaccharide pyruvyl transferase
MSKGAFRVFIYQRTENLGDAIQTVALCRLLGKQCLGVYGDQPGPADKSGIPMIVNGWLSKGVSLSPQNHYFAGVHFGHWDQDNVSAIRSNGHVFGARDPFTHDVMSGAGVKSQMIGCPTLTFDRYTGPRTGRYSIDVETRPGTTFLSNKIKRTSWPEQWELALERLNQLRKAEVVYTNRLHVVLPCLAFGTPVNFSLSDLNSITDKHRLSILGELGFEYNVDVQMDVSPMADSYRRFLSDTLNLDVELSYPPPIPIPVTYSDLPVSFRVGGEMPPASKRKIFYYCHNLPYSSLELECTDYLESAYEHVDILNRNGIEAFAINSTLGVRPDCYSRETKEISLLDLNDVFNPTTDYLVLPELLGEDICQYSCRKVIYFTNLSQGYLSFLDYTPEIYPCHAQETVAIIAASALMQKSLQFTYPNKEVLTAAHGIDRTKYRYCPLALKKPQIAVSRKGGRNLLSTYHTIVSRVDARHSPDSHVQWVLIDDKSTTELIEILQDSLLFLHLDIDLHLPKILLEAMASGCIVAGYACDPLSEIIHPDNQFSPGDFIALVQFIENVMDTFKTNASRLAPMISNSLDIVDRYTLERQENNVVGVWKHIMELS